MPIITPEDIQERRRIEDILSACGQEREWLRYKEHINGGKVRALLAPAREAGINVREISRLTGLSTQTLHTWMAREMRLVPEVHLDRRFFPANTLEEAVLRTIAEDPKRTWTSQDVLSSIPPEWPKGSDDEVHRALEDLARCRYIWDVKGGYQLAQPEASEPGTGDAIVA